MKTDEVSLKPDYSLPVGEVYKDLCVQCMLQLNNLEFLSLCCHQNGSREMPTWVPDLRIPFKNRIRSLDLDGGGEPPAEAEFVPPNTLEAFGVAIGLISTVHSLPSSGSDTEILTRLRQLAPSSSLAAKPYIAGGNTLEAYCRTYFMNQFKERFHPAADVFKFQNFKGALQFLLAEDAAPDTKSLAHFVEDFKLNTTSRVLGLIESGYVGLVPEEVQVGDKVCHILGTRWPLILRPSHDQSYTVIGYAYIDGMNDREAFLGQLPEEYTRVASYDVKTVKWWQAFLNGKTQALQIEDPRLGPLPTGWTEGRCQNK
jgi:hypothetical protein